MRATYSALIQRLSDLQRNDDACGFTARGAGECALEAARAPTADQTAGGPARESADDEPAEGESSPEAPGGKAEAAPDALR